MGMHSSCPICHAKLAHDGESFCSFHQAAFENIRKCFTEWVNAYGAVTKQKYLELLVENASSGEWVVEVARYLLGEGDSEKI
jgi:hypothetical protein